MGGSYEITATGQTQGDASPVPNDNDQGWLVAFGLNVNRAVLGHPSCAFIGVFRHRDDLLRVRHLHSVAGLELIEIPHTLVHLQGVLFPLSSLMVITRLSASTFWIVPVTVITSTWSTGCDSPFLHRTARPGAQPKCQDGAQCCSR
jgi:hypothetical protein